MKLDSPFCLGSEIKNPGVPLQEPQDFWFRTPPEMGGNFIYWTTELCPVSVDGRDKNVFEKENKNFEEESKKKWKKYENVCWRKRYKTWKRKAKTRKILVEKNLKMKSKQKRKRLVEERDKNFEEEKRLVQKFWRVKQNKKGKGWLKMFLKRKVKK